MKPRRYSEKSRGARRAFTLVEAIAAMVVVGTVGGATAALVAESAESYRGAAEARTAAERVAMALEGAARFVREIPGVPGNESTPDIASAESASLVLANGARLERIGDTLWLEEQPGDDAPLCLLVEDFALEYFAADGLPLDIAGGASPGEVFCVQVSIRSAGVQLTTRVFVRTTMVQ